MKGMKNNMKVKLNFKKRTMLIIAIVIVLFLINTFIVTKGIVRAEEKEAVTLTLASNDIEENNNCVTEDLQTTEEDIELYSENNISDNKKKEEVYKKTNIIRTTNTKKNTESMVSNESNSDKEKVDLIGNTTKENIIENTNIENVDRNEENIIEDKEETKEIEIPNSDKTEEIDENNNNTVEETNKPNENPKEIQDEENKNNDEDKTKEEPETEMPIEPIAPELPNDNEETKNYITMENGEKINNSEPIKLNKNLDGLEITDIQITGKGNTSALSANVKNISGEQINGFLAKIIFLDNKENEIVRISVYIDNIKPEETKRIYTSASYDFVNAYDIKFIK